MIRGERSPRIVVAGGGTTGHLSPGLAVAQVLRDRGSELLFVGTASGPESRIVPNEGYAFAEIPVIGRGKGSLTPRNVKALFVLVRGIAVALGVLRRFRPDAVLGTGGYVSLPVVLAARALGVPVVVHEQNSVLGLANRVAARFAYKVCLSFPLHQDKTLSNAVMTGNPVRAEISSLDKVSAREHGLQRFELEDQRRTIFITGGSQGAVKINTAVMDAYGRLRNRDDLQLLHLTGSKNLAAVEAFIDANAVPRDSLIWRAVGYTDEMHLAYAVADLAVCRAGASTIAELSSVGLPAIFVPLPGSIDDDQRRNAEAFVERNAGVMISDKDFDGGRLYETIDALSLDADRLVQMSVSMRALCRPEAANDVAKHVFEAAKP